MGTLPTPKETVKERAPSWTLSEELQQRGPSFRRGLFRGVAVVRHAAGDVAPTSRAPRRHTAAPHDVKQADGKRPQVAGWRVVLLD